MEILQRQLSSNTMLNKAAFFRTMAVPGCLIWGLLEFFALQRSRLQNRQQHL